MSATTIGQQTKPVKLGHGAGYLLDLAVDFVLTLVAYLIAIYLRRTLPFGKFVGENYTWHSPQLYATLAASVALAHLVRWRLEASGRASGATRFATAAGGIGLVSLAIAVFLPNQSGLQQGYFAATALFLSAMVVPWPWSTARERRQPFGANLSRLWANRSLLRIWVRYNVQSRYAQAFLGILWIVLLPLSTALVMSVVFSELLRVPVGNDVPFIAFFLAGLVPWGLFSQSISAGMRSILGAMGLINQIYFPREIIVLSALGEALVDAAFMFLAMLVVNAVVGIWPNPLYAFLPVLIIIQVAFTLGLMFIVSWLSVLVRDIPQLVSVVLQITFYLCPIIYPASSMPERFRFLITLNPVASLIEAYRSIIVYGRAPVWPSLLLPAALSIGFLIFGYRLFKANEDHFADLA